MQNVAWYQGESLKRLLQGVALGAFATVFRKVCITAKLLLERLNTLSRHVWYVIESTVAND